MKTIPWLMNSVSIKKTAEVEVYIHRVKQVSIRPRQVDLRELAICLALKVECYFYENIMRYKCY